MWQRVRASWGACALGVAGSLLLFAPAGRAVSSEAKPPTIEAQEQIAGVPSAKDESATEPGAKLVVSRAPSPGKLAAAPSPKLGVLPAFAPVRATLEPRVREAYERAARRAVDSWPQCKLKWTVLAAIGSVESANGAHTSGAIVLIESGRVLPPIIGPVLDASAGTMAVPDTDRGTLDGDTVWDHAVGPMQFLPSTWAHIGRDGNGDGKADPHSIDDAALTAAAYLCSGERDLTVAVELKAAIYAYNHSDVYVDTVRDRLTKFDIEFGFTAEPDEQQEPALEQAEPSAARGQGQSSTTTSTTTLVAAASSSRPSTTSVVATTTSARAATSTTTTSTAPRSTTTAGL